MGNMLCATVLAAYSFDTWLYGSADYHPNVITTENFTITDITSRWAGIHTTRFHCRYKELRRQKYHWDWKPFIIECHYGSHHPGYDLQARHWAGTYIGSQPSQSLPSFNWRMYTYRHKQDSPWARTPAIKSLGTGHLHSIIKGASLDPQSLHSQRSGAESLRPANYWGAQSLG